jgi:hypothetical protein
MATVPRQATSTRICNKEPERWVHDCHIYTTGEAPTVERKLRAVVFDLFVHVPPHVISLKVCTRKVVGA